MSEPGFTLGEIAGRIGGRVVGDESARITGVAPLRQAGAGDISFLASDKRRYLDDLAAGRATAVVLADPALAPGRHCVVVDDPVAAFDQILAMFPTPRDVPAGVSPAAHVDPSAKLAEGVCVGPGAVIQSGCQVGAGTVIWSSVFVGRDCRIGGDCVLHPGVVLREQTELGDRVVIHSNSTLGADGFGYRQAGGRHVKVPQVGRVVVGDDVEIGANVCIDRAKCGATTVGSGTKIDNLCQIAHNVQIGEHCLIMSHTGIAGATELGRYVVLAGNVGVRDNIRLGDQAVVAACACVSSDIEPGQVWGGIPAHDQRQAAREYVAIRKLPEMLKQVQQMARKLGIGD
ncbi:MAG: UDP-3-O-acylglucosamine N-acyltransferase [Phycisphaerae bacterium]|nr:UDP-3-O-acylglucosamine N-acyltransferase [Phycisphaerae bacterium]